MEMMSLWSFSPALSMFLTHSASGLILQHSYLSMCPRHVGFSLILSGTGHLSDVSAVDMSCILVVKALEWNCMHCFDFKGSLTSPRPERSLPEGSPWSRPIKPRYRCFLGGNLYLFDHLAFGESHWKTFNLLQWCSQANIWFRISTLCERPSAKVWVIVPLKPTQGWCWASGKNITLMYLYLLCTVHLFYSNIHQIFGWFVVESNTFIKKIYRKYTVK